MLLASPLTIARLITVPAALVLLLAPSPAAVAAPNQPPTADFDVSPAYPVPGETVTFTSKSSDPDGEITALDWDLDGDGKDDAQGQTVTWTYTERGVYGVRLRATAEPGRSATWIESVTVNTAPKASFEVAPSNPGVGETATFTSTSTDDGSIVAQDWDLDNDGAFDDASGSTATAAYDSAGPRRAALRVTDDLGAVSTWSVDFLVGPPGATPAPAGPTAAPSWLTPFPTIRIAGRTTSRGARVRLLAVRAPAGSEIVVTCVGRGCPMKRRRATVSAAAAPVRIRSFERFLRAGVRVSVRVTKPGQIGKFTRFRVRRVRAPARWDACVMPGAAKPTECPPS